MRREDFRNIIKLRSIYKIDKRKGNYNLIEGKLSDYIIGLVESQMKIDNLGIAKDGNLYPCSGGNWNAEKKDFDDITILIPFEENEVVPFDKHEVRVNQLVFDIIR